MLALSYGSHEVHTYLWNDARKLKEIGLEAEGFVRLKNSVSPDVDLLRCDLTPALLCTVGKNRSYAPEFSIFEIGSVVAGIDKEGLAKGRTAAPALSLWPPDGGRGAAYEGKRFCGRHCQRFFTMKNSPITR
ncbi:MAG: hypothetical protein ACLR23_02350 [Clostridia bacterium]